MATNVLIGINSDNHPPLPIGPGEHFLRDVYTALVNSPRWQTTLLVVVHDEHGGFFDHVPPVPITSPVPPSALYTEAFTSMGVRVPALVASPSVHPGSCYSGLLDHTSMLQLLAEKFAGDRRAYSDDVNRRLDQGIESLSSVLAPEPRQDVPAAPATPVVAVQTLRATTPLLTEREQAFALAAQRLMAYDRGRALRQFPELVHLAP